MNMKKILRKFCFLTVVLSFLLCFPCCAQETDLIEISEISRTSDGFKVDFSQASVSGRLIVALYGGNNALVALNSCEVALLDSQKTVTFSSGDVEKADSVRAFIWSSLENMTPVSASSPESKIKASFNYKRNEDGDQAFLYRFGTTGNVEISIADDSLYDMNDLNFTMVAENGNTVESGNIFTVKSSGDYFKTVKFTGKFLGTVNINITDKNTNELQDTMKVEILTGYNNVSTDEALITSKNNTCLVPTLANGGVFNGNLYVSANCRAYGNDCLITTGNITDDTVHTSYFTLMANAEVENMRLCGPYVDDIYYKARINEGYEGYKVTPGVSLADGASLKNVYVKHGAYGVEVEGENAVLENVTIECTPIAVRMEDGASLIFKGDNIIDNAEKSGECENHKFGLGIACLEANSDFDVAVLGNLYSHSFITSSEYSTSTLDFDLPDNTQSNTLTINNGTYINPLAVVLSSTDINMGISAESNLYGLISQSTGTASKLLSYDRDKVAEEEADLAFLLEKPDDYDSLADFTQFMYTSNVPEKTWTYAANDRTKSFASARFKKYGTNLPYTIDVYKVYTEENNTTVYEFMSDGIGTNQKSFTVSEADAAARAEFYVIFNVTDIYDNQKVYTCDTTMLKYVN